METAAAPGVEALAGREVFAQQGAVEVCRQQPLVPARRRRRQRQLLSGGQDADLAVLGRRPLAPVGYQQQRRRGPRPEDHPIALPVRLGRHGDQFLGVVEARPGLQRRERAGRVRLQHADPHGLRHVARILHLQNVWAAGLVDRQPIGLPTDVGRVGVGLQLGQLAQCVGAGLQAAVPQRALPRPRQTRLGQRHARQFRQLLVPTRIGRIDLQHLRQLVGGMRVRRPPRIDHHQLHPPLADRPPPTQRLPDRLRPVRAGRGGDDDVVNALFVGQLRLEGNARRVVGLGFLLFRPELLFSHEQLRPDADPLVRGHGKSSRLDAELELLAGGEDQIVALEADAEQIARRPHRQQTVSPLVQLLVDEIAGEIGQGNVDRRRSLGLVGGRESQQQFRARRGGHQHVRPVVSAGTALAETEFRAVAPRGVRDPHRARLVGFEPQRPRLRERSLADRDGSMPEAVLAAAPGDADADVGGHGRMRRQRRQQDQNGATNQPCGDRPGGRQAANRRCPRTSLSDHRKSRR